MNQWKEWLVIAKVSEKIIDETGHWRAPTVAFEM
jgi:hypothetical protein